MREAKADEKEVLKMQKDMAKIAAGKKKPKKKVRTTTRPLARVLSHKGCCALEALRGQCRRLDGRPQHTRGGLALGARPHAARAFRSS